MPHYFGEPGPIESGLGKHWFPCRVCGRWFLDTVPPDKQTDPVCHGCFTGRQSPKDGIKSIAGQRGKKRRVIRKSEPEAG